MEGNGRLGGETGVLGIDIESRGGYGREAWREEEGAGEERWRGGRAHRVARVRVPVRIRTDGMRGTNAPAGGRRAEVNHCQRVHLESVRVRARARMMLRV